MDSIYVGCDGRNPIYLTQIIGPDGEPMVILPSKWQQLLENTAMYYSKGNRRDTKTAERFDNLALATAEGTPIMLTELRWLQVTGLIILRDSGMMHNLPLISKTLGEIPFPIQCPPTEWQDNCRKCTEIHRNF